MVTGTISSDTLERTADLHNRINQATDYLKTTGIHPQFPKADLVEMGGIVDLLHSINTRRLNLMQPRGLQDSMDLAEAKLAEIHQHLDGVKVRHGIDVRGLDNSNLGASSTSAAAGSKIEELTGATGVARAVDPVATSESPGYYSSEARQERIKKRVAAEAEAQEARYQAAEPKGYEIEADAHREVVDRANATYGNSLNSFSKTIDTPGSKRHLDNLMDARNGYSNRHDAYDEILKSGDPDAVKRARAELHDSLNELEVATRAADRHVLNAAKTQGMMMGRNANQAVLDALKVHTDKPDANRAVRLLNGRGAKKLHNAAADARRAIRDRHSKIDVATLGEKSDLILRDLEEHNNKIATYQLAYDEAIRTGNGADKAKAALLSSVNETASVMDKVKSEVVALTPKTEEQMNALGSMAGRSAGAGAGASAVSNELVIPKGSRMGKMWDGTKDGLRNAKEYVAESRPWKGVKTAGKWAGIAAVGALAVGLLVGKRESQARRSQDELNNQELAAVNSMAAGPMVGAGTMMGMEPVVGTHASRILAARGGNPDLGPINPEVNMAYDVARS